MQGKWLLLLAMIGVVAGIYEEDLIGVEDESPDPKDQVSIIKSIPIPANSYNYPRSTPAPVSASPTTSGNSTTGKPGSPPSPTTPVPALIPIASPFSNFLKNLPGNLKQRVMENLSDKRRVIMSCANRLIPKSGSQSPLFPVEIIDLINMLNDVDYNIVKTFLSKFHLLLDILMECGLSRPVVVDQGNIKPVIFPPKAKLYIKSLPTNIGSRFYQLILSLSRSRLDRLVPCMETSISSKSDDVEGSMPRSVYWLMRNKPNRLHGAFHRYVRQMNEVLNILLHCVLSRN